MATKLKNEFLIFLVQEKLLNEDKALEIEEKSLAEQKDIEEIILKEKLLNEEALAQAKGKFWNLPYIDLTTKDIDPTVLNLIPRNVASYHQMIAFERKDNNLSVALVDPKNFQAKQAVEFLATEEGLSVQYFVISQTSFKSAFEKYGILKREVAEALEAAKERYQPKKEEVSEEITKVEEVIKGAPVSRIVSVIMRHAVEGKASDIHIEPFANETRVRYRIDGVLKTSLLLPINLHSAIVARIKVLANLRLDETRVPQDGRITETFDGKTIDFRVSTMPLQEGLEKVVMRILDTSVGAPTLEQLGFNSEHIKIIVNNIKKPYGLFLISGPTGSGKSTTLYTILNMLNSEGVNISTLEDPIEYFIKGVNQSQIRPEVGFTFASGLRALLRQDPNIIMVGEIRDNETAELAIHAALTGHLILSTIHTNNAISVIPRLIDMKVEPFLLAAVLNVAIAQRLARKICVYCKKEAETEPNVLEGIKREIQNIPKKYLPSNFDPEKIVFFKGQGCPKCGGTGYKGRIAVAEILEVTSNLSKIIARGFDIREAEEEIKKQEMLTLRQDALLKALSGIITLEEVLRVSQEV